MLKIGTVVETARACGALTETGSADLPAGTKGTLLGMRGAHAKLELAEHGGDGSALSLSNRVVYLAIEYLNWR